MKDFDLDKIGKRLPYSVPSEDFFERFTADTLERIAREGVSEELVKNIPMRVVLRRVIFSAAAVAAVVLVGVMLFVSNDGRKIRRFDSDLDLYVEELSDDELSTLFYDMEVEGEFYSNL